MNYVNIVNLIFLVVGFIFLLYLFHYFFFGISSLVYRKKYPVSEEKCRYCVVVSCKDEENVIGRLIESIRSSDYPQEKLDILVIAHNCKDKTAEIAENLGAKVIVLNNEEITTLGGVYNYIFSHMDNISSYDGYIFFNADNVVENDYFDKLNDAFIYYGKNDTVTTFRHSLNMDNGIMPALYGLYFGSSCLLAYQGRNNHGVSSRINGCGFVTPSKKLLKGWDYSSITEDVEFSTDSVFNGEPIRFCSDAVFYDEQPTSFKVMWNQRLRWAKGLHIISAKYFPKTLKAIFSKDHKNKMSLYVSSTFLSFPALLGFSIFFLQGLLLLLSPFFGVSLYDAFLHWSNDLNFFQNMFMSFDTGFLFVLLRLIVSFAICSYLTVIGVFIAGHKKYKKNKKLNLILAALLFPLFFGLQLPLDIAALFKRNVTWVKIPHGDK